MKNIRRGIIQIIFLNLKVHWNQAQKPPKTSTNHKLVKLYGFKPPKPWRTSTTNLQIRRTFEAESSKLPAWISKFAGIKLKSLQKPQQTTNQWSSTDSSLQSPEELPLQTFKYEEHSKQNHLNYLPRSQSSLESSLKAFRNLTNRKLVKLYGFKPLKHRRTSTTNLQRRRMH